MQYICIYEARPHAMLHPIYIYIHMRLSLMHPWGHGSATHPLPPSHQHEGNPQEHLGHLMTSMRGPIMHTQSPL